ncbi:MAG: TetR/AcrR family transcriptional regulator [candidate division WOR-3 bacterium]|nr:TetR/AcrR family transcriptional regulator [candidate division WOR-3 bacterium]
MQLTKRQREIIETSLDIINKSGIQSLTMRNIAGSMGVTDPMIYRHFRNKEQLINMMISYVGETVLSIIENTNADKTDMLRDAYIGCLELFDQNPSLTSVVFSEEIFRNNAKHRQTMLDIISRISNTLKDRITGLQNNNLLKVDIPADYIVQLFMAHLRMDVRLWRLNNMKYSLKDRGSSNLLNLMQIIV